MSTQEPRFEPASNRWLFAPIEATRIACGFVAARAFAAGSALPLFPAPATTAMPRSTASAIASFSGGDGCDPGWSAKDRLITCAPWSAAQRIPRASVSAPARPSAPNTFTGRIRHLPQMPAAPSPLSRTAPISAACSLPWPFSSVVSALPSIALKPGSRFGARSGFVSTPVSTTATTTRGCPRVTCQACGTDIDSSPARLRW